jgi:predicted lactoylglutathione lyase
MNRQMFVNLPVEDLPRSIRFFTALGFGFNPRFTDDTATCMIVSQLGFVMLLQREKFASFAPGPVADAREASEVLTCLSCDSREEVDDLVRRAVSHGGSDYNEPQDHGFMYGHGFRDPDGHVWELIHMQRAPETATEPCPAAEPAPSGGAVVHWEMNAREPERLARFYEQVFGWSTQPMPGDAYRLVRTGSLGGGISPVRCEEQSADSLMLYIDVADLHVAAERIAEAGGTVHQGIHPVEDMGSFMHFTDPEGRRMGLWQTAR